MLSAPISPGSPAPIEPRIYRVTPAQANAYKRCGLEFYSTSLQGQRAPETPSQRRGTHLHALIEFFTDCWIADGVPLRPHAAITTFWPPKYSSLGQDEEMIRLGERALEGFITFVRENDLQLYAAEKYVRSRARRIAGYSDLAIEFSARIDAVARRRNEERPVLLDYKTGSTLPSHSELQASPGVYCYGQAAICAYNLDRSTPIEIIQLLPHVGAWVGATIDEAVCAAGRTVIVEMVRAMDGRSRDDFVPVPGPHCAYCTVDQCPVRFADQSAVSDAETI